MKIVSCNCRNCKNAGFGKGDRKMEHKLARARERQILSEELKKEDTLRYGVSLPDRFPGDYRA